MTMKLRALVLAPLLGASAVSTTACTTTDMQLLDLALQLYVASEYLDGDCPFGQDTYYDTWKGHYSCGYGVKDGDRKDRDRHRDGEHHGDE
jgi:hypothetical protein